MDILESLLLLNKLSPSGSTRIHASIREGISPGEILERIQRENLFGKAAALGETRRKFEPARELDRCHQEGIDIIAIHDARYPQILKHIYDPPLVLYVRGQFLDPEPSSIAVVGSRHASVYGLEQARKISHELAESGIAIISGLARGIDEAAHRGALSAAAGRTIAVLGCGVDIMYPRENAKLYEEILERGVLVSEFPLGSAPNSYHFPRRNRIISGLSLGVLVVEAHTRSGSLITANLALEQGKEVFALPGPVNQLASRGTHKLIKNGACLVESAADILEGLFPIFKSVLNRESGRTEDRKTDPELPFESVGVGHSTDAQPVGDPVEALFQNLGSNPVDFDALAEKSTAGPASLASTLLELELAGKIKRRPDGYFARV